MTKQKPARSARVEARPDPRSWDMDELMSLQEAVDYIAHEMAAAGRIEQPAQRQIQFDLGSSDLNRLGFETGQLRQT